MSSTSCLQVLDDGRLTDSKGRTVDFKNTVLIMTSNLGAHLLQSENLDSEAAFDAAREQVMQLLRQSFRPEFLNRVDDVVIFRPLGEEQLEHIVDLRLADLRKLLEPRKITLELTPRRASSAAADRIRPAVWGSSVEESDPAPDPGSAGHQDSGWRGASWRSHPHRCRPAEESVAVRGGRENCRSLIVEEWSRWFEISAPDL